MTNPARFDATPPLPETPGRDSGSGRAPVADDLAAAIASAISRSPRRGEPAGEAPADRQPPQDPLAERLHGMQLERLRRSEQDAVLAQPATYAPPEPHEEAPESWAALNDDTEEEWRPYAPVLGDTGEQRGSRFRRAALAAVGAVALVGASAAGAFVLVTSGGPTDTPTQQTAEAEPATIAAANGSVGSPAAEENTVAADKVPKAPEITAEDDRETVAAAAPAAAEALAEPVPAAAESAGTVSEPAADAPFSTASVRTTREVPPAAEPADEGEDAGVAPTAYAPRQKAPAATFEELEPGSDIGAAPAEPAPLEEGSTMGPAEPTTTASVTSDVNMRAEPSNEAAVVRVVPDGASVDVVSCDGWCEVAYSGERGFIYNSFVNTGSAGSPAIDTGAVDSAPVDTGPVDISPVDISPVDAGAAEAAATPAPTEDGLL